jgi:methylaspartate mutase epsilon subunit
MGFSNPSEMRRGLLATRWAPAPTVGTITLDSYTRTGDVDAATLAVRNGDSLNGYPLLTYDPAQTKALLHGVRGIDFPVQVRHGTARPQEIFAALIRAGLDATEGGPVSYCLPYSRLSLSDSVRNWTQACKLLAATRTDAVEPHLETFGGCIMGQLCPPSLLVAISVLEAMFFVQHGLRSVSLSYSQQTDLAQDLEAVSALHSLGKKWLPPVDWHVVVYTYMGLYPRTAKGARCLLQQSAKLAQWSGASRLIVKTAAEAFRIPSIDENIDALLTATHSALQEKGHPDSPTPADSNVYAEAASLVEAVANLDQDIGVAITAAFARGYLDVPYCLHPDNAGQAKSYIDTAGRIGWSAIGSLPIRHVTDLGQQSTRLTSTELLASLSYVASRFDGLKRTTTGDDGTAAVVRRVGGSK